MAKSTINLREINQLADKIAKAASETERNVQSVVVDAATLIHKESSELVSGGPQRTGRISRRGQSKSGNKSKGYGRRTLIHQASREGEPAKTDTGVLVASNRIIFHDRWSAETGSLANIAPYGEYLEDPAKMNRPWLAPTLDANKNKIDRMLSAAIKTGGLAS